MSVHSAPTCRAFVDAGAALLSGSVPLMSRLLVVSLIGIVLIEGDRRRLGG